MSKAIIGIIIAIAVIGGGAVAILANRNGNNQPMSTTTQSTDTPDSDSTGTPQTAESSDSGSSQQAQQGDVEVNIRNQAFTPSKITIKKGTKVTWTNQDNMEHDIAPDEDYGDAFEQSDLLSRGESYSFTFNKVGMYTYHCTPHPFMKGTIEVTE